MTCSCNLQMGWRSGFGQKTCLTYKAMHTHYKAL